jgi:glycerol-3-phosphate dehydrogenase (NAD(P)+)
MLKHQSLTVLGGGSFGTALVKIFNDNEVAVTWYVKEDDGVKAINTVGQNPHYLSSVQLNTSLVHATSNIEEAIAASSTGGYRYPFCIYTPRPTSIFGFA